MSSEASTIIIIIILNFSYIESDVTESISLGLSTQSGITYSVS